MHWPLLRVAVAERSMEPTLRPGDWLLVLRTGRVRPGQLVVAWHPSRPSLLLVKRVLRREPGGWWLQSDSPNGSAADIAGICNNARTVVGLMPHPEHAVDELTGPGHDGLGFFESVISVLAGA